MLSTILDKFVKVLDKKIRTEEDINRINQLRFNDDEITTQEDLKLLKQQQWNDKEQLVIKIYTIYLDTKMESLEKIEKLKNFLPQTEENELKGLIYYIISQCSDHIISLTEKLTYNENFSTLLKDLPLTCLPNRFRRLGATYLQNRQFDFAESNLITFVKVSKLLKDDLKLAHAYHALCSLWYLKENYINVQEYSQKCISICKKRNFKNILNTILMNQGQIYDKLGNFDKALKIYYEVLPNIPEENIVLLGAINANIALSYRKMNQDQKAINYYLKSYEYFKKSNRPRIIMEFHINIARAYVSLKQNEKVIEHSQKAYIIAERLNYIYVMKIIQLDLDYYKLEEGQSNIELKESIKDKIRYFQEEKNTKYYLVAKNLLSKYYYEKNNYKEAFDILNKTYEEQAGFYKNELIEKNQDYNKMIDELVEKMNTHRELLNSELETNIKHKMIGNCPKIKAAINTAKKASEIRDVNVLITGESGTGKEIFSRLIHYNSERKENRLVTVNCSAITASLAESEFFGHVQGSFTGAISNKKGFFEQANNGTLYLDEIGDMPMDIQAKLLRAIESRVITPVGSDKEIEVDVRIVASTNKDLDILIKNDLFRLDLLHRINAVHILVPPLRERGDDIILLIEHYVQKLSKSMNKKDMIIDSSFIESLQKYNFPGNVRELRNVIERSIILETGNTLTSCSLPSKKVCPPEIQCCQQSYNLAEIEKQTVLAAMKATNNSQKDAAKLVGLSASAFSRKLKKISDKVIINS